VQGRLRVHPVKMQTLIPDLVNASVGRWEHDFNRLCDSSMNIGRPPEKVGVFLIIRSPLLIHWQDQRGRER
jgi:hypothetical protein